MKKWKFDLDESKEYTLSAKGIRVMKMWASRMRKRLKQLLDSIESASEIYIQQNNVSVSAQSADVFINEMFKHKFKNDSFKRQVVPEQDFLLKNLKIAFNVLYF